MILKGEGEGVDLSNSENECNLWLKEKGIHMSTVLQVMKLFSTEARVHNSDTVIHVY